MLPPDLLYCGNARINGKVYYNLQSVKSPLVKTVYNSDDVTAMGYKVSYMSATLLILQKQERKTHYSCTVALQVYNPQTGATSKQAQTLMDSAGSAVGINTSGNYR